MMTDVKEFYVGVSEISAFLRLHYRTCSRYLKQGRVKGAKKDCLGRWVLAGRDYYASLRDPDPQGDKTGR